MDIMSHLTSRSAKHVAAYTVLGGAVGYLSYEFAKMARDADVFGSIFYYILAPCLASILILPSWGFNKVDTYWRAPAMCALALVSWAIIRYYFGEWFHWGPGLSWDIFDLLNQGAADTFAILGYIVRAVTMRRGSLAAATLILLGAATNLMYLPDIPLSVWIPGAAHMFQYACTFGLAAWAAAFLPQRTTPRTIETVLVESRARAAE